MRLALLGLALLLAGCASLPGRATPEIEVVRNYHAALNRRDLLALTAYVAPDVQWYSQLADERVLEVSGREALTASLQAYFAQHAETYWSFESATVQGNSVAVRERSQWRTSSERDERVTLCVYELHDGRIRRVTQYLSFR